MLRPLAAICLVLGVVAAPRPAHATSGARAMGMYVTAPTAATAAAAPLPMVESKIEVTVRGAIVETVVTQRFANRGDRAIEATYIFPLPPDAAVSAMSISAGARTIHAAIEKRDDAQRRYEAAVSAGVAAAELDQERPDVFTQTVAAIPPNSTVEVTLRYDAIARYGDGTWQLVLPMVVAPRFVPGTVNGRPTIGTGRAPDTDRAPDASRVTPATGPQAGGPTTVAIHFAEPVGDVASPTHELADAKPPDVAFTDRYSDHDAVIRWKAKVPAAGWLETGARGGYAAVIVEAPPAQPRSGSARVMLLLDRAASMRGDAAIVAQPYVRALFAALGGADRVAVIGSDSLPWSAPADAMRAIEAAWQRPTSPLDLTRTLAAAKPNGAPIVLVSDGLVADDAAAIAAAKRLGVPVHVIGVGPAPARGLLTQLAAATGGTVRFVLPVDDLTALARATVLDVATQPQPLSVNWGTLVASDVVPATLPRLGAGQAVLVLARVQKPQQAANVRARGELFALEQAGPDPAVAGATSPAGPLARRWARVKLDDLLAGRRDIPVIIRHALEFGLVSPYTSLVAIGTDVVVEGGTKRSVAVPVSAPAGMHWNDVKRETTLDFSGTQADETTIAKNLESKPDGTKVADKKAEPKKPPPEKSPPKGTKVVKAQGGRVPAAKRPESVVNPGVITQDSPQPVSPTSTTTGAAAGGESIDGNTDRGDDDEDGAPDSEKKKAKKSVAAADAPDAEMAPRSGEMISLTSGSLTEGTSVLGRGYRLALGVGGGLSVAETRDAIISANARVELGRRRSLVGIEGDLVLVGGLHAEGRVLLSYSRIGIARLLELGFGLGLHLGDGAGPAAAVSLRVHLPPAPWVSAYLRYDGALLIHDNDRTGQNAGTIGIEAGF